MSTALVWFRRDLRLHDHPALHAALARHEHVAPVFVLDDRLLHGRFASGPRTQFMLEALADVDAGLAERGARLVMRRGRPEEELVRLAAEVGAREVHFQGDLTPFARLRGRRAHTALTEAGVALHAHPGLTVADDVRRIRTTSGGGFSIFSPFYRRWLVDERRDPLPAPAAVALPAGLEPGRVPALEELGLAQELSDPMPGGERAGLARFGRFLERDLAEYGDNHDTLEADRTSRMSPYFHFGCVSPRWVETRVLERGAEDAAAAAFQRQLCWRDFYLQVIHDHPENARQEMQERFRDTLEFRDDVEGFAAWAEGRTGYPLVDAGMRQMLREGWMHNQARLVTGSFLTKTLGLNWRQGERVFMRYLLCGDEAVNNGNWQWIASVGTDPAPVFRRIYSPARRQARLDPQGRYVREYVPELRGVPDRYLAEPWTMPPAVQEEVGCVIGRDYPAPVIDQKEGRKATLERFREAAGGEPSGAPAAGR